MAQNQQFQQELNNALTKARELLEILENMATMNTVTTNVIEKSRYDDDDDDFAISMALKEIGISPNLKGYRYLKEAVKLTMENGEMSLTKELYPQVARECKSTSTRVERAIRHSIENAFSRTNVETLYEYFGGGIDPNKGKLTNGEFIAGIAEKIRIDRKRK